MKKQRLTLKERLIDWAIENGEREFFDYLMSKNFGYKKLLRYWNAINHMS